MGRGDAMTAFAPVLLVWAKDVDREQTDILSPTDVEGGGMANATIIERLS